LAGIFFPFATVCIAIVMWGAIAMVHLAHGFDVARGGLEYAFTHLLMALALLLMGPGAYSLGSVLPEPLRIL
jgi:putative oxidoreductase